MGTAVRASRRGTLRCVFRGEMAQRAEALDPLAVPADQPEEDVHIMAGLLQEHGARLGGISPVAPDEAVGLMPVAHIFDLIDGCDLADLAPVDQIFQGHVKGCVAQHMAHRQDAARPFGCFRDPAALVLAVAHGLFQKDMVPKLHGFDRGFGVVVVQCADKGAVRHPGPGEKLLPGRKAAIFGDIQRIGKQIPPVGPGLRHGDDLKIFGKFLCISGVCGSPASRTQYDSCDRFHVPSSCVLFFLL